MSSLPPRSQCRVPFRENLRYQTHLTHACRDNATLVVDHLISKRRVSQYDNPGFHGVRVSSFRWPSQVNRPNMPCKIESFLNWSNVTRRTLQKSIIQVNQDHSTVDTVNTRPLYEGTNCRSANLYFSLFLPALTDPCAHFPRIF